MKLPLYQIDAFTDRVFAGNPAGVCPLGEWLPAETMQAISQENNLPETVFFVPKGEDFEIRWFTPTVEIDLAGHPTLAAGHLILNRLDPSREQAVFHTQLGDRLAVVRDQGRLAMDFPARPPAPRHGLDAIGPALGADPGEVLAARDGFAVFNDEDAVRALAPDMAKVAALDFLGIIATAPGKDCDFVSRFFAPGAGVPEDPVTGSAHCTLIPYWGKRLAKQSMFARQISARGGEIWCRDLGDRVTIAGRAAVYMEGTITI